MAGTSIGSTALHLSIDGADWDKGLSKAEGRYGQFVVRIKSDADNLKKEVRSGFGLGDVLKIGVGTAGGLAGAFGISALASGIAGIVTDSVKLAASVEDTKADFKVMLGDANKAAELFKDIQDFASATPLTTKDLSEAAKQLVGVGVAADQVVPTLKAIGDLSGASGEKLKELATAYGRVRQQGRLTGDTLESIQRLAPITDQLAKVMRVSEAEVRGLVEEGKIGFPDLQRAINGATGEGGRFFNHLKEGSQTLGGLFSTLQDNWDLLRAKLGQIIVDEFGLKGFVERLSAVLNVGTGKLDGLRPIFHDLAGLAGKIGTDLADGGFKLAEGVAEAKDLLGDIRADYGAVKRNAVGPTGFGEFVGSSALGLSDEYKRLFASWGGSDRVATPIARGAGSDVGPSVAAVRAWKKEIEDAVANIGKAFAVSAAAEFTHSLNPLGDGFAKAVGKGLKEEFYQLTDDMLKRLKALREEMDPGVKLNRDIGDLDDMRKRGGFFDFGGVAKGFAGGGGLGAAIAGMVSGVKGDQLFNFAAGKIGQDLLSKMPKFEAPHIAEPGSREAIESQIEQMNRPLLNQVNGPNAANAQNIPNILEMIRIQATRQADFGREMLRELRDRKIIPAF